MAKKGRYGLTLSNRGILLGLTTAEGLLELAGEADAAGVFEHVWNAKKHGLDITFRSSSTRRPGSGRR